MKFKDFLDEELRIVKKNWNLTSLKYNVEMNDKIDHNMLDRILLRTNLKYNEFQRKVQSGINYVDKKKITKPIMIGLYYKKSNFTVLFFINPDNNYLRVSTVLDSTMEQKNTVKWELNEFNKEHNINLYCSLNECKPDLEYSILIEPWNGIVEVHYNCSDCLEMDL